MPLLRPRSRASRLAGAITCVVSTSCTEAPLPPAPAPAATQPPAAAVATPAPAGTSADPGAAARDTRIQSTKAIAFGAGGCGALEGGEALACRGTNFEAFTDVACVRGRTNLHPLVVATARDAYSSLESTHPSLRWQYGDFGWASGGRFPPHKTHQNGLSADFFVPVVKRSKGERTPAMVPVEPTNKYGYGVEFDGAGRVGNLEIDWWALTDHLSALEEAGKAQRTTIRRVILAPELQAVLIEKDPRARRFAGRFSKRKSWVRHDEHYHIDFDIPSELKRPLSCD